MAAVVAVEGQIQWMRLDVVVQAVEQLPQTRMTVARAFAPAWTCAELFRAPHIFVHKLCVATVAESE